MALEQIALEQIALENGIRANSIAANGFKEANTACSVCGATLYRNSGYWCTPGRHSAQ